MIITKAIGASVAAKSSFGKRILTKTASKDVAAILTKLFEKRIVVIVVL